MIFVSRIRRYVVGIIIGGLIGFWVGVNYGKGEPLYSYPFNNDTLTEKAKRKADDILKDTKKTLREKLKDEADDRIK